MKISVVTPFWQDRPAAENMDVAQNADRLGYDELWVGEMATYDAFALATAVAHNTVRIALTIGPLAVSVRTPMTLAMGVASVVDLTGRRTALALGASSTVVVEEWHGRERKRTAKHLAETAQVVRGLLDGGKVVIDGELASCRGYRLRLNAPHSPLTIAAFGPAAVRVAARFADRMVLNMVTPAAAARLRSAVDQAAAEAGRDSPRLAVWLPAAVNPGAETRAQMLRGLVGYLAAPGYGEMMSEAGFSALVELARTRPHPRELLAAMPAELVASVGLCGTESHIAERLDQYAAAGVDEVCIVPATAGDPGGVHTLEVLRPAVAAATPGLDP